MFKKIFTVFGIILIFSSLVSAQGVVRLITDKDTYYEGETITVGVEVGSENGDVNFMDMNLIVMTNEGGSTISFQNSVSKSGGIYSSLNGQQDTNYKNSLVTPPWYYGWWLKGDSESILITSSTFKDLGEGFTALVNSNVLQSNANVELYFEGTSKVEITEGLDIKNLVADNTFKLVGKTITIKQSICGDGYCNLLSEDATSCVSDCTSCTQNSDCTSGGLCVSSFCSDGNQGDYCKSNTNCALGNFCVLNTCEEGQIGNNCDGNDNTCDSGLFCVVGVQDKKCSSGSVEASCVDDGDCKTSNYCDTNQCVAKKSSDEGCTSNVECLSGTCNSVTSTCEGVVDSDGDGIDDSKENVKCKNTPQGAPVIETGIYAGCIRGDMDLNGVLGSEDLTLFVNSYVDRSTYNSNPQSVLIPSDIKPDNSLGSEDLTLFVNAYVIRATFNPKV